MRFDRGRIVADKGRIVAVECIVDVHELGLDFFGTLLLD